MDRDYYAHSIPDKSVDQWQKIKEKHLRNVGDMAGGFAETFGAGEWGYLGVLWHVTEEKA